jgi:hypothetical protein
MASAVQAVAASRVSAGGGCVSCLWPRYQKSPNCRLELLYAVACNKPLILVLMEGADMVIEPWLRDIVGPLDVHPLPPGTAAQFPQSKYLAVDNSAEYVCPGPAR